MAFASSTPTMKMLICLFVFEFLVLRAFETAHTNKLWPLKVLILEKTFVCGLPKNSQAGSLICVGCFVTLWLFLKKLDDKGRVIMAKS